MQGFDVWIRESFKAASGKMPSRVYEAMLLCVASCSGRSGKGQLSGKAGRLGRVSGRRYVLDCGLKINMKNKRVADVNQVEGSIGFIGIA